MSAISASQREKMAGGPGGPEVNNANSMWIPITLFYTNLSPFCFGIMMTPILGPYSLQEDNVDVQVTREMRIENEAAGSVIGKGGQKVGEIRKISGAQVKVKFPGNQVDQ